MMALLAADRIQATKGRLEIFRETLTTSKSRRTSMDLRLRDPTHAAIHRNSVGKSRAVYFVCFYLYAYCVLGLLE